MTDCEEDTSLEWVDIDDPIDDNLDDDEIEIDVVSVEIGRGDFNFLKTLGKGGFGKVYQVRKTSGNDAGTVFALKVIQKEKVLKSEKDTAHTMAERKILETINHPFIVNMHYAFETKRKLYIVLEYLGGGELFMHLEREALLKEEDARFYLSEILLALRHLHKEGVIYRDLKPENILLDAEGHVKITDFGLCKQLVCDNTLTYTMCGTYAYMAPEVVTKSGHGKAADWWSFGALAFDMLTGDPPFRSENKKILFDQILHQKLKFPRHVAAGSKDLIRKLMRRPVHRRLGGGPGNGEDVKSHVFFRRVKWDDVLAKRIEPPFKPQLTSDDDVSLFDSAFTSKVPLDSPDDPAPRINPFSGFAYVAPSTLEDRYRNYHSGESSISQSGSLRSA